MLNLRTFSLTGWAIIAGVIVALLIGLVIAINAWGQSRYNAGVRDTDARWEEAGRKLERQARASSDLADRKEAGRIQDQNEQLAEQKERIDEAVAAGDSPFDVLFGGLRND